MPPFEADVETSKRDGFVRGRAILYCSKKQGWKALASPLTAGTYEKEHAPAGCFGVWQTSAGERKAWMVHLPQDTDPKTGAIIAATSHGASPHPADGVVSCMAANRYSPLSR